jgi:molecular chaperone HtpG
MTKIVFPKQLKDLLEGSELEAPIRALADQVGTIVADNKATFFPAYTDHGIDHINGVLKSEVELVPKDVWQQSSSDSDPRLLCDADAAVLIGATLLHDFAMHLHPKGFVELVDRESRFKPLPWFDQDKEGHTADIPWHDLWAEYEREAKRFSDRALQKIVGLESIRSGWRFKGLPTDTGQWLLNDRLIVGEFIRRHHARLAHEIAIFGFPGVGAGPGQHQFPALGREPGNKLRPYADLIGLAARSHWKSLRLCQAYLDEHPTHHGTPRPMRAAVLYSMALLRVADFLQIDRQRAPVVLLQLRDPQSPLSRQEWGNHLAILSVGQANDSRARMVTVSEEISWKTCMQIKELLSSLQAEIDHATAVLDEAYGALVELGLDKCGLSIRRVRSNLDNPAFYNRLQFVPRWTGFSTDPNLLSLLVRPLYGNSPSVGIRELMQNAVDAVRELEVWCRNRKTEMAALDLPPQEPDVLVDYIRLEGQRWLVRVRDKGIGMTSNTLQDYFLRAGASFRHSVEWAEEFHRGENNPAVVRAGRFGIGVFAVFLLGSTFRLQTRHASATRLGGLALVASAESESVEIRRAEGLPVGTTIEVELSRETIAELDLEKGGPFGKCDWYCWDWPRVVQRVMVRNQARLIRQRFTAPGGAEWVWNVIHPSGFDAVHWTFDEFPELSCNGFSISNPAFIYENSNAFDWPRDLQLERPSIAVIDSAASLPLTIQRYALSQAELPFIDELARDICLSFIAHALICGPESQQEALGPMARHPLSLRQFTAVGYGTVNSPPFSLGHLRWCSTASHVVPLDPWLFSLLESDRCLVWGSMDFELQSLKPLSVDSIELFQKFNSDDVAINWDVLMETGASTRSQAFGMASNWPSRYLADLARYGIRALGYKLEEAQVVVSVAQQFDFRLTSETSERSRNRRHSLGNIWSGSEGPNTERRYWKIQSVSRSSSLLTRLHLLETQLTAGARAEKGQPPGVIYLASLLLNVVPPGGPISPIAKAWKEVLGSKAIPYNLEARQSLIESGLDHPEFRRHIHAWTGLKQSSS